MGIHVVSSAEPKELIPVDKEEVPLIDIISRPIWRRGSKIPSTRILELDMKLADPIAPAIKGKRIWESRARPYNGRPICRPWLQNPADGAVQTINKNVLGVWGARESPM